MSKIERNPPPFDSDMASLLQIIDFIVSPGFINFYQSSNGGVILNDEEYIVLWPLTDIIRLNEDFKVEEYASDFFIFGSDGGGIVYAFKKDGGEIYQLDFIGMSNENNILRSKNFDEFLGE